MRTFPNIATLLIISLILFLSFFLSSILISIFPKLTSGGDIPAFFLIIFILLIIIYNSFWLLLYIYRDLTLIDIHKKGLLIFNPIKFQREKFKWIDIKAYSYSKRTYGKFSSSTIIIYTKSNKFFEIVEIFNIGFDGAKKELKKYDVEFIGKNQYLAGVKFNEAKKRIKNI